MNRSLSLHPLSLVLGVVFAGICFISMSQVSTSTHPSFEVVAQPRDFIQIKQGFPYIVPPGKVLVVTALGTDLGGGGSDLVSLAVNGQQEAQTSALLNGSAGPLSM